MPKKVEKNSNDKKETTAKKTVQNKNSKTTKKQVAEKSTKSESKPVARKSAKTINKPAARKSAKTTNKPAASKSTKTTVKSVASKNTKNAETIEKKDDIKKEKKAVESKNKVIITIIQIVFLAIMIYSGIKIYNWMQENKKSSEIMENVQDSITVDDTKTKKRYTVDFQSLKEKNEDTVAWLKVEGTKIECPIVKASDNSYYLTHSFDDSYNSAGWPFMDYHNSADGTDRNMIIYGHNRKDGSMFGSLSNILNEDWQNNEENKYIALITENENAIYEVFSVYSIEDEDYYITTSFSDESFSEFVERIKNRSYRDFGNTVTDKDHILTLSTCANDNRYRVVLHAKKISEEEYMSK